MFVTTSSSPLHAQAQTGAEEEGRHRIWTVAQVNVVSWSSAGARSFKGAKKGTAYAAQVACEAAVRKALESGLREVQVFSRGPGSGKEAAIRTVANLGLKIRLIKDVTPVAHNGCRPKGRRRV